MFWATTGKTAAELIESQSNPEKPNMDLPHGVVLLSVNTMFLLQKIT